ncbi:MAG: double-strand break repair protein AddB, partial [Pseudomonadota bacterium]
MKSQSPPIFTIPAGVSFADSLTARLLRDHEGNLESLADTLILLPTRRAARVIRDSFLRQTEGKPILLPRLQALGDIDEEELSLQAEHSLSLPPAISTIRRQAMLAQLINKLPNFGDNQAHNLALAEALGRLLDQIYTENLDMADLPHLVDAEQFARHWQVTLDFLNIISIHWPKILNELGMIDAADRRNKLILALHDHWQKNPPRYPVIIAGTTGSIPATTKLLKQVLGFENGQVILPALDQTMNDQAWSNIDNTHPQATLKNLLETLEVDRYKVGIWEENKKENYVFDFISQALTPAETTNEWQNLDIKQQHLISKELEHKHLCTCETPQEEATIIGLIMRDALEDENKITALITPDRDLAKRVSQVCLKWGIKLDDSAGKPLSQTLIGNFSLSLSRCCLDGLAPVSMLSFLKHSLNQGGALKNYRSLIRELDKLILRGLKPERGFKGLKEKHQNAISDPYRKNLSEEIECLLNFLEEALFDFYNLFESNNPQPFYKFLKTHIETLEKFSNAKTLWNEEEGETVSTFFSSLLDEAQYLPEVTGQEYHTILKQFMDQKVVRPRYGTHPRLMILGQLEARLIHADRVILAGLNEGTWPAETKHDPWMSRPMRKDFGLPPLERGIGLSAHDFVYGFCQKEVFLTRSKRNGGTPTVPARWLIRIEALLKAYSLPANLLEGETFHSHAKALHHGENKDPLSRPAPNPPISKRPIELSVTAIETWLKDPYSIHAKYILKLQKLEPLEKEFGALERGNLLHTILEKFNTLYPKKIPTNGYDEFLKIANEEFQKINSEENDSFWQSKIQKIGNWYIAKEKEWRLSNQPILQEQKGSIEIKSDNHNFILSGR